MAAARYDILSIGDTTTDVFLDIHEATVHCELKSHECLFCITYADKVPVERFTEVHAVGNAANNANGSARLGLRTAIWTILGDDRNGAAARHVFREEGVETRCVETDRRRGTNFSAVLNFRGERTILVYHEDRRYRFPKLPASSWIYLTSMGKGWERIIPGLLKHLKASGARFGFNPGTHQMKSGLDVLKPLLAVTTAFIVNVEEAQRILQKPSRDISLLLRTLVKHGPKTVVITDGPAGAYGFDGRAEYFMPIYPDPKPVVERTGCGDAFSTGFLAAQVYTDAMTEGMQWGAANARMVVQYIGAREGLQTKGQILRTLRSFPKIVPQKNNHIGVVPSGRRSAGG